MPFAKKFRAMMDLPMEGDPLGDFEVESIDVADAGSDWRGYRYSVEMVLCGPGGKEGVRRAMAPILAQRVTTFSSYGNPYQLWFGRPDIESLGDRRYAVTVPGGGARIDLDSDLERFARYLEAQGYLAAPLPSRAIEDHLADYRIEVKRRVDRYKRSLTRRQGR